MNLYTNTVSFPHLRQYPRSRTHAKRLCGIVEEMPTILEDPDEGDDTDALHALGMLLPAAGWRVYTRTARQKERSPLGNNYGKQELRRVAIGPHSLLKDCILAEMAVNRVGAENSRCAYVALEARIDAEIAVLMGLPPVAATRGSDLPPVITRRNNRKKKKTSIAQASQGVNSDATVDALAGTTQKTASRVIYGVPDENPRKQVMRMPGSLRGHLSAAPPVSDAHRITTFPVAGEVSLQFRNPYNASLTLRHTKASGNVKLGRSPRIDAKTADLYDYTYDWSKLVELADFNGADLAGNRDSKGIASGNHSAVMDDGNEV